ncbi:MAG: HAMP domain-containing sensor histidine kinase [Bacteroidales bacterium]|jgi:signal transduction histidine kinase|nr:HAMP domain-containing sensor histidine kinase [Bacteroidales bacterium]
MNTINLKITPLIITIVLVLLAFVAESLFLGDFVFQHRTARFNRILKEKEKIMETCVQGMSSLLAHGGNGEEVPESELFSLAEENGITILEYMGGKLAYWSDTDFDVPGVIPDTLFNGPLVFMQNGWFLVKSVEAVNEKIVGLLRIKSEYGFENDIIKNNFAPGFGMPEGTTFSTDRNRSPFQVFASDGTFLFSLVYPGEKGDTGFILIPMVLWVFAFIFIVHIAFKFACSLAGKGKRSLGLFSALLIFLALYFVILVARRPAAFFQTDLFLPYRYRMNDLIPTLGHLLVLSILVAAYSYLLYRIVKIPSDAGSRIRPVFPFLILLLIPAALLTGLHNNMFSHLVFNSNVNFEAYKVLELDIDSLAGFISVLLLAFLPFLYINRVTGTLKQVSFPMIASSSVLASLVFIPFLFRDIPMLTATTIFFVALTVAVWFFNIRNTAFFNKSVVFSLIAGLYSLFVITLQSEKKTEENVKIQLVTYSTENDPTAEHLLLDMWPAITTDSLLKKMMDVRMFENNDFNDISDYLHDRYFNGYWGNFNLNIYLCSRNDSIRTGIRNLNEENCFSFFERKIIESGHQLTGTQFYFIDSKQGRSSYLGRLFFGFEDGRTNGLFMDLYSDIKVFQPGYTELLLDKKYHSYARLREYSFVKYINGEMVLTTGDFTYDKTDAVYVDKVVDFRFFKADLHRHALYRNGNVTVMISRPELSVQDILVSFAYIFAFILIFSHLAFFIVRKPVMMKLTGLNFRQKMQISFIGILLVSFTIIGTVVSLLAVNQYKERHYENIREKLSSIQLELENTISSARILTPEWRSTSYGSLEELLVDLSNIFNTDINLFDRDGYLIATSRPEIFFRNLTGRRMSNIAIVNLTNLRKTEYLQSEMIGNLEFVSAYVPFQNQAGEFLAFLNLPYFRMQSVLAREISNMIVAVINFTLLLVVITMALAVFISGRLTSPLAMLSSRLASVELGKKSEHLSYKGNDEVGDLVRQYNIMVDELEESARKLADSEREYAWREMAKQIAHEIKNPLTPMKLNVQQLFKSWSDRVPGFDKELERFTRNQIEYIDNLSSIASAFSSFAKIPAANPVRVDLMEQVRTTAELFKNSDNISLSISCPDNEKILIFADKEQVNSIFSNLVKNAIQAIEPGREGNIEIRMEKGPSRVLVSVSDNGSGIPESLRNRMFTPNFTTKSSGTGLGLSIAKRYAENAGGRIWYESESGKGSVFYVEFPLYKPGNGKINNQIDS